MRAAVRMSASRSSGMKCEVCFRQCDLEEGQEGFCKARVNQNGQITARNYGKISSAALDPIEKKPLVSFYPGSMILSVGSYGCSLRCPFCQNHEISQVDLDAKCEQVTPEQLVDKALELVPYGNIGIAFTYNEPMVGYEFIRDTAKLAHEKGLKTVVVTSGNATVNTLEKILPYIDAFNVDLKGFTKDAYRYVGGDLETTKNFIARAAKDAHVEVTTLVVPGKNDSVEDMERMARWLSEISPDIVLHLSRYFPRYHETIPPTSVETLKKLRQTAQKCLHHVVLGNV